MSINNTHTAEEDLQLILNENLRLSKELNTQQVENLINAINDANRIFFLGTGRSGLALKIAAMRMMHLGLSVFVVGEIVTPAILEGDLLIVASGSGTTSTVVSAVKKANKQHAKVFALTADENSELAQLADELLLIKAAVKTDFGAAVSEQYAGSLFEQFTFLVFESVFMSLWKKSGLTKEDLWPKHANLE